MTDLTQIARGKPCMIRLIGICNGNPETTVFCHLRKIGLSGTGLKAPDYFGAFGCSSCHDVVDGRVDVGLTYEQRWHALTDGFVWTLLWLIENGYVGADAREPRAVRLPKTVPRRFA